ncbi:MAG: hypothetical protein AB7O32_09230 [Vicinamibacterales bacterium]
MTAAFEVPLHERAATNAARTGRNERDREGGGRVVPIVRPR